VNLGSGQLKKDWEGAFRLLFDSHPQAMWVFDIDKQTLLEANAAAAALLGYTREELRDKRLADLLGEEQARSLAGARSQSGKPGGGLRRYRTRNGRVVEAETAVYEIEYNGRPAGLCVLADMARGRQVEEEVRQAQKMEAVGMLAGGVAHDFNNLLTIITGYSHLILNTLGPQDPSHHAAAQILKAGERAAALTKQLLAFSRRQVPQPRVLDLNDLVTGLSGMLQRLIGEDIDLRVSLGADLGRVRADPGQIEQVLMNLAVNARDAMPKGGSLTIETRNVELDESYSTRHLAAKLGPHVMLAVTDNGHGMDQATRSRLFEPFFTTKTAGKGTGLGLSTVLSIVQQSGGSLDLHSEPDRGTSIEVYLPRIDQPVAVEAEVEKRKAPRATETVLVVEDDDMVRMLVRETLAREGFRVIDAVDPIAARRTAENHKGEIHLLITDVVMPKGSGLDLAAQLTARRPAMKVLYMSGYTDTAAVSRGILERGAAFLQKPFAPSVLVGKVHEVLEDCRRCGAGN